MHLHPRVDIKTVCVIVAIFFIFSDDDDNSLVNSGRLQLETQKIPPVGTKNRSAKFIEQRGFQRETSDFFHSSFLPAFIIGPTL